MLHREIIAVGSEIHTKHTNTLCGQNVEVLNVKLAVNIVTTGNPLATFQVRQFTPTTIAVYARFVLLNSKAVPVPHFISRRDYFRESTVLAPRFLTLCKTEWSFSRPDYFTPGKTAPFTNKWQSGCATEPSVGPCQK